MEELGLYTIGYQGRTVEELLERLRDAGVAVVADVRELPLSRIKGFSRRALSQALEEVDIRYVSVKELGSPRHMRHEYRKNGDWESFVEEFREFLRDRQQELDALALQACKETTCLLCFERESEHCHRSILAEEIEHRAGGNLRVIHL